MSLVLICYDIADHRRRARVARLLEAHATRVQESVFEAHLSQGQLERLLKKTRARMRPEEDTLRAYRLCGECANRIEVLGVGERTEKPDLVIV